MIKRQIEIKNRWGKEVSNRQVCKELEKNFGSLENVKGHKLMFHINGLKCILAHMEKNNLRHIEGDYMLARFKDFDVNYIKLDEADKAMIIIDKINALIDN